MNGRGIDADFVGTGVEHGADIVHRADAAAHRQRNKDVFGDLLHRVYCGFAAVGAGGDIEKADLIGALFVIAHGDFYRVTSIADIDEIDALDDAPVVHIQAGNNTLGQPHAYAAPSQRRCASATSSVPS